MTEPLSPSDGPSEAGQEANRSLPDRTPARRSPTAGPDSTPAKRTATSRRTEEHDAVDQDARFRRPPPGKPALLPEEPPRNLDDTPVAGFAPPDEQALAASSSLLAWDEAQLLAWAKTALMVTAFVLPLVIIFSLFDLVNGLTHDDDHPAVSPDSTVVDPTPAAPAEPVEVAWPTGIAYPAHTVPALIKDEIASLGAQMGYSFTGQAGTTWAITIEPREDSAFNPQVTLYAPSGTLLATNDDRAPGVPAADLILTLPESGDYRVLVESSAAAPTFGSYLLALFEQ